MKNYTLAIFCILLFVQCQDYTDEKAVVLRKSFDRLDRYQHSVYIPAELRLRSLENNLESIDDRDTIKKDLYYRFANFHWNVGNYGSYKKFSLKGIGHAKLHKKYMSVAKGYVKLADYYSQLPSLKKDSAYYYLRLAAEIYKNNDCQSGTASINLIKAELLYWQADYTESEIYALQALAYYKKVNMRPKIYQCYTTLGISNLESRNFKMALKFLNAALYTVRTYDDNWALATAYNNVGKVHLEMGHHNIALKYFEAGLKIIMHTNSGIRAVLLENKGIALYKMDKKNRSISAIFKEAIRVKDSLHFQEIHSRINVAEYYTSIGDTLAAKKIIIEAYKLSKKKNDKDQILALKALLSISGNKKLNLVNDLLILQDRLNNEERRLTRNVIGLNQKITVSILEKDKKLYKSNQILIWVLITLTILIISYLIFFLRIKKKEIEWLRTEKLMGDQIYNLIIEQKSIANMARSEEKRRIAMDLHDSVINSLTSIRLNLHVLLIKNGEDCGLQSLTYLNELQMIEREIRGIAYEMVQSSKQKDEFEQTVRELVSRHNSSGQDPKVTIMLKDDISLEILKDDQKFHIISIIQEAISNSKKHAKANNIYLQINQDHDVFNICIEDDGIGFQLNTQKEGMGISNIFYRAKVLNAQIKFETDLNMGTKLYFQLKIRNYETENANN